MLGPVKGTLPFAPCPFGVLSAWKKYMVLSERHLMKRAARYRIFACKRATGSFGRDQ
jgi:hypothetical protein